MITLNCKLDLPNGKTFKKKQLKETQKYIDRQIIRLSDPYTPKDTGMLIRSVTMGTVIGSGKLVWNCPYSKAQYEHGVSRGLRGKKWVIRMWRDKKKFILQGAKNILNGG